MKLIKEYYLKNGLILKLFDKTYRYFGEYFFIEIEAVCEIPKSFIESHIQERVKEDIPENLSFKKILSKKGVYETELEKERTALIENFEKNGLEYLDRPTFIEKFIKKEIEKIKKRNQLEELRRKLSEGEDTV